MAEVTSVRVSKRHQIVLPRAVRRQLKIEAGDRLLVDVQDGVLVLIPQPENPAEHLAGLHQEVWATTNGESYLGEERAAWSDAKRA